MIGEFLRLRASIHESKFKSVITAGTYIGHCHVRILITGSVIGGATQEQMLTGLALALEVFSTRLCAPHAGRPVHCPSETLDALSRPASRSVDVEMGG